MEFKTPLKKKQQTDTKLVIPASPFMKKIGYGTGVAVYEFQRSPLRNQLQSPWAVKKMIKKSSANDEINKRLKDEADILRKLQHRNVVGFRAFIEKENVLAMEECTISLGDAIEQRFDVTDSPYPVEKITKVASDIAQALRYLHVDAKILHCDVKSYNILIKGDFEICKLCDFGVCLPLNSEGNLNASEIVAEAQPVEYNGTVMWCAPEILSYPQVITCKADVYAYGLVMWEMVALMPPVFEEPTDTSVMSVDLSGEGEVVSARQRPDIPEDILFGDEYNSVLELFFICTEYNMDKRPNANEICEIISTF